MFRHLVPVFRYCIFYSVLLRDVMALMRDYAIFLFSPPSLALTLNISLNFHLRHCYKYRNTAGSYVETYCTYRSYGGINLLIHINISVYSYSVDCQ